MGAIFGLVKILYKINENSIENVMEKLNSAYL